MQVNRTTLILTKLFQLFHVFLNEVSIIPRDGYFRPNSFSKFDGNY